MKLLFRVVIATITLLVLSHDSQAQNCFSVIPYPMSDPCVQQVIAADSYCCDFSWDSICQDAYDACDPGGGGGDAIEAFSGVYSVPELIQDVLLGSCVSASNVTNIGAAAAFGHFTNGSTIGFEEGIIMSTGNAVDAPGPENGIVTTAHNTPGDPILTALGGFTTNDAAIIEFDFVSPSDFVSFEYVFASSEYANYTCGSVNDVFGFFITGPGFAPGTNVALVPGTSTPVSINTVNQGFPSGFNDEINCTDLDPNYSSYSTYFNNNIGGSEIGYNGYTDVFTVELDLVPCETYHIKMAIADGGDSVYDSVVFLKAGSFTSGLEVDVIPGTSSATLDALEGCQDGYFMFVNQGPEITEPTDFHFEVGGTATMGVDYEAFDSFVTFQPGQDTVIIDIIAFLDGIDEGLETITLTFPDVCTCEDAPEVTLNILDNEPLVANISEDITICTGSSATLEVEAEGSLSEPYTYDWSTGENTPTNDVSPLVTTTYTVTVTDACGSQVTDLEVTVTVGNEITVEVEEALCDGESYTLPDGTTTDQAGFYTFDYVTPQGCDSIVELTLLVMESFEGDIDAAICEGETYTLADGTEITSTGEYTVDLQTVHGCDSTLNYNVVVSPVYDETVDAAVCEGETYTMPDGSEQGVPGSYTFDFISSAGCDSSITVNLGVQETITIPLEVAICDNEDYELPDGTLVADAGYYEVTLDQGGCDTLYQIDLSVNPTFESLLEPEICVGENYTLPDGTNVSTSGSYISTLTSVAGCDSVINVNLTVLTEYDQTLPVSLCNGESYTLDDGTAVDTDGLYAQQFTAINGCDSIVRIDLEVNPTYNIEYVITACENETVIDPNGNPITEDGNYLLEYTTVHGCDSVVDLTITVNPSYLYTITDTICEGEQIVSTSGAVITTSGQYPSQYQTTSGCDSVYVHNVTVIPNPITLVAANPKIASIYDGPVQFYNESLNTTSFSWDFGVFGTTTEANPVIDFNGVAGKYPVCLNTINDFGCIDQYCFNYVVREEFAVFIPNAFTPNGDGINDLFYVAGKDIDPDNFHLIIVNRNGETVFESRDPKEKWDGSDRSNTYHVKDEVYVYKVKVSALSWEETREFTGKVTVLR